MCQSPYYYDTWNARCSLNSKLLSSSGYIPDLVYPLQLKAGDVLSANLVWMELNPDLDMFLVPDGSNIIVDENNALFSSIATASNL